MGDGSPPPGGTLGPPAMNAVVDPSKVLPGAARAGHAFLHADWREEYLTRGYVVLRGVFSAAEMRAIQAAAERAYAEGMRHHATWRQQNRVFWIHHHPAVGRFVSGCQWQAWVDPVLDAVRTDARLLAMLAPLIGRDLKQIINQVHWKAPGTGHVWSMHQDVRSRRPAECFRELDTSYVQTGLAIGPHTKSNGAMRVIPGSHLRGDLRINEGRSSFTEAREDAVAEAGLDPDAAVAVEMEPGDVALWSPYVVHGGGINRSRDDFRPFYINGYVTAANCDRGQPVFADGVPVPLVTPAVIQHEDVATRTEAHYPGAAVVTGPRD